MEREHSQAHAEGFAKGTTHGYQQGIQTGLTEGRKQGIAMERSRIRPIEWAKLFGLVVVGSAIGCGIILAVAIGLSNL